MLKSLEDYIIEMENRSRLEEQRKLDEQHSQPDLWTQLQQKENDLLLAAELGKALLDKNEELKRQHDNTIEEYSKKLELLEQDRHLLKRKLTTQESDYESRLLELQNDIADLTSKLTAKSTQSKQTDREKTAILTELQAQNVRLTAQLTHAALAENQLQAELEAVREQCAAGKSSLNEHISGVESLRGELDLQGAKGRELERRLHLAAGERDRLAGALEEAADRVQMLERRVRDQEMRLTHSTKEYELPREKIWLEDRLQKMDISEPTLSQECMSVYRQLRSLVQQLKSHTDDDSGLHSDCSNGSFEDNAQFSAGLLSEIAQELVGLVLDTDVVRLLERLEQARREIQERDMELGRRSDKIMELSSKVSVIEVELQAAVEELDRVRSDASSSPSTSQDELVARARAERDLAVARRTKSDVELAKTRVELMQANSQLLEAIQQKVELSQQLEQWQMDMQELIDEQLKHKLGQQSQTQRSAPVAPPRRRLLDFFLR